MDIEQILKEQFHYDSFKEGQAETIHAILAQQHTLSILPTGTGKSLCYQLPSYLFTGVTVVVSPLLSLMEDQVTHLEQLGEKHAVAINSLMEYQEKKYVFTHLSTYKFIFLSPEMLLQSEILTKLSSLTISLLVIDEAHCISQWGIDFRPEYTKLNYARKYLHFPLTLALTATATKAVRQDIQKYLFEEKEEVETIQLSVDRPNIFYRVVETADKFAFIQDFVQTYASPGIIYFSSKKEAEQVAKQIRETTAISTAYYHGDLTGLDRRKIQQQFLANEIDILCATSAFGMGINKPNIRYVLHYHLPASIEAYMQESGRAGRDGAPSQSVLLYTKGDEQLHFRFQEETEIQAAELVSLIENHRELESIRQEQNNLQAKWLAGYVKKEYTMAELQTEIQRKISEKKKGIQRLIEYIHTPMCRRAYLLQYFHERKEQSQRLFCCDSCDTNDEFFEKKEISNQKRELKSENWEETLKKLFFEEI